ncbi:MAG: restriction endonuclease subunit S [Thermoleophilia bacterium]
MEVRPGYKRTEVGLIPEDWDVEPLGELSDFVTSGSRGWAQFYSESGALFIRSQNVREGRLSFDDVQFVTPPIGVEGNRTKVESNDLLITITGNSVGNVALVEKTFDEAYVSQHVGLVRLKEPTRGAYICRYLSPNSPGNPQISGSQSGQSKPGLNLQNLKDFRIALPPTANEQHAIATALCAIDALLGGLDRLIAKKRDLKQAAMQQLLTGQTRLPGFHGEWEVKRFGELGDIRSGGTPSTTQAHFWNGDVPWCTPTDITELLGRKYLIDTARTISAAGLKASSAEVIPPRSLIMTSRATIGECAINLVAMTTNQGFKNLVPFPESDVEFLYYLMTTQKAGLISLCGGSTFLEISKKQICAYEVTVPNERDEQTAIAAILSDMDAELAALEARRDKTRDLKQAMMQELLTGRIRLL